MAAPYGQNDFSFKQQSRTRNNDPIHLMDNTVLNAGPSDFVRPGQQSENSFGEFAPMQFRPRMMHQPPPRLDIFPRPNGDGVPTRFTTPVEIAEKRTMNVGPSLTDFTPRFLPPPPVGQQPFNNQRIGQGFVTQQQMISDSSIKSVDHPGIKTEAIQSVGPCLEDKRWLEQWLNPTKPKTTVSESQQPINLSEIQVKTRHMLVLIAKLQKQRQILETLKDEDKSIWDQKVNEIERVKVELEQLQSYLTSTDTVNKLDKKILNRKKKRERLKRLRQERYEQQCEDLAQREQKHSEIDKNLEKIRKIERDAKQEKDLQKEVDNILGQVRKKITENSRATQLLQGLQKLRHMRKDRQERQGVRIAGVTNDNVFNTKVGHLSTILGKQDQVYKAEESALKVILETEQEETREKEREKDRQREMKRQIEEQRKAEQTLFGSYKEPRPDDPLYPFKQYYDAANNSFEAFLNIRHDWDKYLVLEGTPGGSRIPESWVTPPEPSSDIWASALNNR